MVNKKPVSWTIDEEIIDKIEKEGNEQKRSSSFIVNEILIKHFNNKRGKGQ